MKTRGLKIAVAMLAAGLALGVGATGVSAQQVLRLGTVLSPQDPMGQGLERLKEKVEERTNGEVVIEVFHNSQLGDTRDMLDQARAGANVGTVTDVARLASFVPELAVLSAPFLFDDFDDADKFAQSEPYLAWGEELTDKAGLVMLASNWYQDARHALTQKPIASPADLKGVKMRTIGAPVWIETIAAMGATPTPIAWGEVYSALQLGTIDAAEAQPTAIWGAKLYEVIKDVNLTGHIQLVTALVVGEDSWSKLTPEQQAIVLEEAVDNGHWASQLTIELGEKALKDVAATGVNVNEVDREVFKEAVAGVYGKLELEDEVAVVKEVLGKQ